MKQKDYRQKLDEQSKQIMKIADDVIVELNKRNLENLTTDNLVNLLEVCLKYEGRISIDEACAGN